jgi:phosphoribosyl 1,2-cyclic phosphodiesterase
MKFSALSSGSKANCTFLGSGDTFVLIDVGLSARQVELRLAQVGHTPQQIGAIVVTHEHSDHISGVMSLSRKHRIPVYANAGTKQFLKGCYHLEEFDSRAAFSIDGLNFLPVAIQHDASEPVGFVVDDQCHRVGVLTDLGRITPSIRAAFAGLSAIILESNHDQELLQTCGYPWHLKQRISSTHGHLSNDSAASFLADLADETLTHVILAHLSENSNTPRHALASAKSALKHWGGQICCASVAVPTPLVDLAAVERPVEGAYRIAV